MNFNNSIKAILVCFSCLLVFDAISQTSTKAGKKKILKVLMDTDAGRIKGYIYNVTDTTVTISHDFIRYNENILTNATMLKTFNYQNIKSVTNVRRGSIPIGALAGAGTGALIGLATYSRSDDWLNFGPKRFAFAYGILGAPAGTLAGVLLHKRKFRINRDMNRFQTFKSNVDSKVNPNQDE